VTTVPANLTQCSGARVCGGGQGALVCSTPPHGGLLSDGTADVTVEVTLNGQDYTDSGSTFSFYDPSVWRLHSFHPRGGPLGGNTSISIDASSLRALGDVRCRFAARNSPTDATVVSTSLVRCSTPAHWNARVGARREALALTLNGQDYLHLQPDVFTFYALDDSMKGLSVVKVAPQGGPMSGGTLVEVSGTGLVDLGGVMCRFGGWGGVVVQATRIDARMVRCTSPALSVDAAAALQEHAVDVTINSDLSQWTASSVTFEFFDSQLFNVTRLHPLGGPIAGGTQLTVYPADERLLVDLGGTAPGLFCRFRYWRTPTLGAAAEQVVTTVPANLTQCSGARVCGGGQGALVCSTPPHGGLLSDGTADVTVEVTLNGQDYTDSGSTFSFYDPSVWRLHSFHPRGGPLGGNTSISIDASSLRALGDVRCRFAARNSPTDATVVSTSLVRCSTPAHWNARVGARREALALTLNGQDYLHLQPDVFTFYALDDSMKGLSVVKVAPQGGPMSGGTLVEVSGTGLVDLGGVMCRFGGWGGVVVQATRIDARMVRCTSPALSVDAAAALQEHAVDVTINGQVHAFSTSATRFSYYEVPSVALSSISPRGAPIDTSVPITIFGAGFRDLNHGRGLFCRFDDLPQIAATLISDGSQSLRCMSPTLSSNEFAESQCVAQGGLSRVRVALNGAQQVAGIANFTFLP